MELFGKNISLLLIDGNTDGRWLAEVANWSGAAYKLPREYIEQGKSRDELNTAGVYFLLGVDENCDKCIYIGETEDINVRLKQHLDNYSFWTEVIAIVSKDGNLNKAHIKYLELMFYNKAFDCGEYILKNNSVPAKSKLSERDRVWLDEFMHYSILIANICGHRAFEKEVIRNRYEMYGVGPAKMEKNKRDRKKESVASQIKDFDSVLAELNTEEYTDIELENLEGLDDGSEDILTEYEDEQFDNDWEPRDRVEEITMTRKGVKATLKIGPEGVMHLAKGSVIRPVTGDIPKSAMKIINEAVIDGRIVNCVIMEDIEVTSLSQAATICSGRLATGNGNWRDSAGNIIKDLNRSRPQSPNFSYGVKGEQ